LAQALELPPSHVHRLLQTLVERSFVERHKRQYTVGVGALRFGHALLRDIPLRRLGLPLLQKLSRTTRWSAVLSVPFDDAAVTIAHVAFGGKIRPTSETLGTTLQPGHSASGTLRLALLPEAEQERVIGGLSFAKPDGASALRRELRDTAERGYGVKQPKSPRDSFGLAVPVFDPTNDTLAAIVGVSRGGTTQPTSARLDQLLTACRATAAELRHQLSEPETNHSEETPCPPQPQSL
ncbi:MAG: helix-turn-helix domain-containing protein, partial [Planctomycetota bacterium]